MENPYHNDSWFVDLRGELQGPLTSWEIVHRLLSGEMKVVHRCSTDKLNWKAICNEEYFETAVQHMLQTLTAEATRFSPEAKPQKEYSDLSGFHNLGNLNDKINAQLEHAQVLQEINATMNGLRKLQAEMATRKKMVIEAKSEVRDELHPDDKNVYLTEKPPFFGPNLKKKLIVVTAMAAVIAGAFQVIKIRDEKEKQKQVELFNEVYKSQQVGDYEKVIAGMRGITDTSDIEPRQLLDVIEVHVSQGKFAEGQALLDKLDSRLSDSLLKSKASSIQGFIASRTNKYELAVRSYEQALREGSDLYLSLHNLAVLHLSLNNPEKAEPLFLKAISIKDAEIAPSLLGLYETALQLDQRQTTQNPTAPKTYDRLKKVESMFNEYLNSKPNSIFVPELTVALVNMTQKFNKPAEFKLLAEKFAGLDPKPSATKDHQMGLDYQRTTWAHVYSWCLDTYQQDQRSALLNAFFGACLFRARGAMDAKPYIEYAANVEPENPVFKKLLQQL